MQLQRHHMYTNACTQRAGMRESDLAKWSAMGYIPFCTLTNIMAASRWPDGYHCLHIMTYSLLGTLLTTVTTAWAGTFLYRFTTLLMTFFCVCVCTAMIAVTFWTSVCMCKVSYWLCMQCTHNISAIYAWVTAFNRTPFCHQYPWSIT